MKFKYKVEIVIDEEKVINDDIYDPKEMYEFIRNMFKRFDLAEIKTDKPYHLILQIKAETEIMEHWEKQCLICITQTGF